MPRQLVRYRQPLAAPSPNLTLARPIRRRSFQNEVLREKFDAYLAMLKKSPHTRVRYGCWIKQFGAFLGDKNFAAVKSLEVRAWLATIYERGFQKATMASAIHTLRKFYQFLRLGDQVLIEAPRQVLVPKISKRLPLALSLEEIVRVIRAASTCRDTAILELFYATGLRVSELSNLRIEEVHFNAGSLMVRNGKWGKDRLALFGRPAAAALGAYLGDRGSGFVFQPAKGASPERRLSPRSILRIVVKCVKRAGIEKRVTCHTFRHSFASALLDRDCNLRAIQELMGHSNLSWTQRYLHVATAALQKTHAKFHPRG
jgi:integrase/recombinase XerC